MWGLKHKLLFGGLKTDVPEQLLLGARGGRDGDLLGGVQPPAPTPPVTRALAVGHGIINFLNPKDYSSRANTCCMDLGRLTGDFNSAIVGSSPRWIEC